MRRHVALTLGAALVAVTLAGCTTPVVTTPAAQEDRITTTGQGTAVSAPDRAVLTFGVTKSDPDPRKAMSNASATSNRILAALKKAGVADKDLQTGNISLDPQYAYPRGLPPRLTGYNAAIDVVAKTGDFAKIGDVIVAATTAGAGKVSGINFELSPTNPTKYTAAADAVTDARKRAEAEAKAAGRQLGDAVTVGAPQVVSQSPNVNYAPRFMSSAGVGLTYSSPEIQPGQLTEQEQVTVTFQLK